MLALRPPLTPGFMYSLSSGGVDDLAGNRNSTIPTVIFLARNSWSPAFESTATFVGEPWPGLVVRRNADHSVSAFVFARRDGSAWFGAPFNPFACAAPPCPIATDTTAPAVTLAGPPPRGHKGWVDAEGLVATLQVPTFQGAPSVLFRRGATAWAPVAAPPSAIFSDGTTLSSVRFDTGNVSLVRLDGGVWVDSGLITSSATDYPTDALAEPFVFGNASLGGRPVVALKSSRSDSLRASLNAPPWGAMVPATNGPEARPVIIAGNPTLPRVFVLRPNGAVDTLLFLGLTTGLASNEFTNISSFDAISNWGSLVLALSSNGILQLKYLQSGGSAYEDMPGPLRNGMPSLALNHDLACEAARPELAMVDGLLFVAWQERCAAGPWRVYVRALE